MKPASCVRKEDRTWMEPLFCFFDKRKEEFSIKTVVLKIVTSFFSIFN